MSSQFFRIEQHVLPCQYIREYPGATLDSQEEVLQLHIKQYIPLDEDSIGANAITIIAAHANGFPKELYEPLWDELYKKSKGNRFCIRSIWIADVANQGMSYVLNEGKTGNDPSWMDHSRDLLHMINHFRNEMPRPLVGVGHSFGGAQLVNLSLIHPRLLTTLALLDPVMQLPPTPPAAQGRETLPRMSTFRRDIWESRSAAIASFSTSPFYFSWDPRVFKLWNEYALRELPTAIVPSPDEATHRDSSEPQQTSAAADRPVTLTTPKHQEVFTFLRPNFARLDPGTSESATSRTTYPDLDNTLPREYIYPFYRPEPGMTLRNLPHVRPGVLYIFGGASTVSRPEYVKEKLEITGIGVGGSGGAKEGRVKGVTLPGVGHLVAMEAPCLCAVKVAEWLGKEVNRWVQEEEEWKKEWEAKPRIERQTVSEEWKRMVGGDPRQGKEEKKTEKL